MFYYIEEGKTYYKNRTFLGSLLRENTVALFSRRNPLKEDPKRYCFCSNSNYVILYRRRKNLLQKSNLFGSTFKGQNIEFNIRELRFISEKVSRFSRTKLWIPNFWAQKNCHDICALSIGQESRIVSISEIRVFSKVQDGRFLTFLL
jgi:hypothetical protein